MEVATQRETPAPALAGIARQAMGKSAPPALLWLSGRQREVSALQEGTPRATGLALGMRGARLMFSGEARNIAGTVGIESAATAGSDPVAAIAARADTCISGEGSELPAMELDIGSELLHGADQARSIATETVEVFARKIIAHIGRAATEQPKQRPGTKPRSEPINEAAHSQALRTISMICISTHQHGTKPLWARARLAQHTQHGEPREPARRCDGEFEAQRGLPTHRDDALVQCLGFLAMGDEVVGRSLWRHAHSIALRCGAEHHHHADADADADPDAEEEAEQRDQDQGCHFPASRADRANAAASRSTVTQSAHGASARNAISRHCGQSRTGALMPPTQTR